MSWFKLDDRFFDNPKIAALSDAAQLAYIKAGTYCARELTDGFVPLRKAREYAPPKVVKELVPGLWEVAEGGFRVHDYLEYNPTREQVLRVRAEGHEAKVRAGKAGAASRWQGHSRPLADGMAEPIAGPWQSDNRMGGKMTAPYPIPGPTGLLQTTKAEKTGEPGLDNGAHARGRAPPEKGLTEEYVAVMAGRFPSVDVPRERQKFEDYNLAKARRFKDYKAAFRNWLRGAEDRKHEEAKRLPFGAGARGAGTNRDELVAGWEAYARGE